MSADDYTEAYYHRDQSEYWFNPRGLLRPDQLACVCYLYGRPFWDGQIRALRQPSHVLSIGAGEGFLERWLEMDPAITVVGVDTSADARRLYLGKTIVETADADLIAWADSLLFVESLEHLPRPEIDRIFAAIRPPCRVIIVNWPDCHPINPDGTGWDHVTCVDDHLFDTLKAGAAVIVQRGSHLVLDFSRPPPPPPKGFSVAPPILGGENDNLEGVSMASRRVRWVADAQVLRIGGGGIPVAPGTEIELDEAVADELVDQQRAVPVGWKRDLPQARADKEAKVAEAKTAKAVADDESSTKEKE